MKHSLIALLSLGAAIASAPAVGNSTPFYFNVDVGSTINVSSDGFEGYCTNSNCFKSIKYGGLGMQLGLGWVATPRVSFEVNYFQDAELTERIPERGRNTNTGSNEDLAFMNAYKAKPAGYGLRVRYFIPLSERFDLVVGSGWQKSEIKFRGINAERVKNSSLQHTAGITYAVSQNVVGRLEYHYKQDYYTSNGLDYSDAQLINFGLEYHF